MKLFSFLSVLFVVAVMFMPVTSTAQEKIVIELKNEITTSNAVVRLSDIANISHANIYLHRQLKDIVVMKSPRPGVLSVVTRTDIVGYINQNVIAARNAISWQGRGYVRIYAVGQTMAAEKLKLSASHHIETQLQQQFSEYEYRINTTVEDITLPLGDIVLKPELRTAKYKRRQCVWVDIFVNGESYQSIPVWFAVNAYVYAPQLKKDVSRNSYLSADNVIWVKTAAEEVASADVFQKGNTTQFVFSKDMSAGEFVFQNNVKMLSDVMNGQVIQIQGHAGDVVVTVKGVAINDGNVGEIVKVHVMNNSEIFSARVINKAIVKVGS